jgi:uncharacterized protein YgiB involved in biofilm formation
VKRHDVTDPANPIEESWWLAPAEASFWTARAVTTGADGYFVASSRGVGDVPGRLYTFIDRAGDQADRPLLGSSSETPETAAASTGGTPTTSAGSTVSAPGLGLGTAVAALGLGGWGLWRRGDRR